VLSFLQEAGFSAQGRIARRRTTARISLSPPRTPLFRVVEWYCRRRYGAMVDPGKARRLRPGDAGHRSTSWPAGHISPAVGPCGRPTYGVDAAFMPYQRRERGIHAVWAAGRRAAET
jgi:hypothetical protein